ncbi:MAG: succinate dehydrogenase, hydrophobic membrane anchor protein [Pseudomonadota bacterium]
MITNLLRHISGLGPSPQSSQLWWMQRVTALALVPLGLWLIIAVLFLMDDSYQSVYAWVQSMPNTIGLIVFTLAAFHHAQLGMQVIYEDYLPQEWLKLIAILLTKTFFLVLGLAVILAILRIYVSPLRDVL